MQHVLQTKPTIGFFEVISENYMGHEGPSREILDRIAANYPVVLHGVSLSIGSTDPLDLAYLEELSQLAERTQARWISDHVCWTGVQRRNSHDLLPLPLTEQALRHVTGRVREVTERLGRHIVLENPSTYARFKCDQMPEEEFLARLAEDSDCGILLDLNNVYVSAFNVGLDPEAYVDSIPVERVVQIHLAGHTNRGSHLLDTHAGTVCEQVWALYRRFIRRAGPVPTLVEWDAEIPPFADVLHEAQKAATIIESEHSHAVTD